MWNASRGFTIQLVHNDTPIDFPNLAHLSQPFHFPNWWCKLSKVSIRWWGDPFPNRTGDVSWVPVLPPRPLVLWKRFTLYPHRFLAFSQLSPSRPSECVHTFLLVVERQGGKRVRHVSLILRSGNRTPFSCTNATVICNTGNTDPAWNQHVSLLSDQMTCETWNALPPEHHCGSLEETMLAVIKARGIFLV